MKSLINQTILEKGFVQNKDRVSKSLAIIIEAKINLCITLPVLHKTNGIGVKTKCSS
ncbi:MAG: hypothetical protein PHF67_04020 [Candidatus Nanoarchaeia archaeon]|nr:hypothetical protein [Candidatus Nanoarchaeia archaeon]